MSPAGRADMLPQYYIPKVTVSQLFFRENEPSNAKALDPGFRPLPTAESQQDARWPLWAQYGFHSIYSGPDVVNTRQLRQSLGLINLHAAILTPPAVVALISRPRFRASTGYILALTYLDLNLAQLGHDLLGFNRTPLGITDSF